MDKLVGGEMTVKEMEKTKPTEQEKPIKFDANIMAFVNDKHTFGIVEEVIPKMWRENSINLTSFEKTYDFLKTHAFSDICVIDLSDQDDIRECVSQIMELDNKDKTVVVIGLENEVSLYRDLIEIGIADYLVKPVTAHEIQKCLNHLVDQKKEKEAEAEANTHEQIVVVGTKGGVGASTVAVNMAWILSEELNHYVQLMDLDIHYGTAALMLDIQPCGGLRDALKRPDRLDNLLLSSATAKVTKKLSVLATEESPNNEIRIDPASVTIMSDFAKEKNRFSIVDLPRTNVHLYDAIFRKSEHALIVSDLSLVSIRDAVRLKKIIKQINPKIKIHFVVNRHQDLHSQVKEKDFERGVDDKIAFIIPDDPKAVGKAANAGCAISKLEGTSKSARAIKEICQTFATKQHEVSSNWIKKLLSSKNTEEENK